MAVKTSSSSHFTPILTEGASDTISIVSGRCDVKMNALGLYGILSIDFLFSKIIGFVKNKKDVTPTARLERQRDFEWNGGKYGRGMPVQFTNQSVERIRNVL